METKSKLILQTHHSLTHESHSLTNLTHESLTHKYLTHESLTHKYLTHEYLTNLSLMNLTHESFTHSWISLTNLTHESHSRILFMNFYQILSYLKYEISHVVGNHMNPTINVCTFMQM